MYTSTVVLTLTVSLFGTGSTAPVWHRDYGQALTAGQMFGRPIAIFVADASNGAEQALQEGDIGPQLRKVLAEQYICVVLDPSQDSDLVRTLAVTKNVGVVISDRAGSVQAFHHDGKIGQEDLTQRLWQFADPTVTIRTTQSNAPLRRVSFYPNGSSGGPQPVRVQNC